MIETPASVPTLGPQTAEPAALHCLGADTELPVVGDAVRKRVYLDSAATTLMAQAAHQAGARFLPHYASTHSDAHLSAEIAHHALLKSREAVLRLVGAHPDDYVVVFNGSGATGGLNWLSRALRARRPGSGIALLSTLEHHANDLPHRLSGAVERVPLVDPRTPESGTQMAALADALAKASAPIDFVTLTGASNVTGIMPDLAAAAALCAEAGVPFIIDGAQWVPHCPVALAALDAAGRVDALVFSGHKLYAPGSPGVVVLKRTFAETLPLVDAGGGMVESVYPHEFTPLKNLPERLEPGTPNLPGAIMLGAAANALAKQDMTRIRRTEHAQLARIWRGLEALPGVRLYGPDPTEVPRTGCVPFNIKGLPHGLSARILSDYFAIEVRNGCFCAEPYVRTLLRDQMLALELDPDDPDVVLRSRRELGLVRASLGAHLSAADVDYFLAAMAEISAHAEEFAAHYQETGIANWRHRHFRREIDALLPWQ